MNLGRRYQASAWRESPGAESHSRPVDPKNRVYGYKTCKGFTGEISFSQSNGLPTRRSEKEGDRASLASETCGATDLFNFTAQIGFSVGGPSRAPSRFRFYPPPSPSAAGQGAWRQARAFLCTAHAALPLGRVRPGGLFSFETRLCLGKLSL